MTDEITGDFKVSLCSDYNYLRGTRIEIDCVRYDVFKRIIDAITPIMDEEKSLLEKEWDEKR